MLVLLSLFICVVYTNVWMVSAIIDRMIQFIEQCSYKTAFFATRQEMKILEMLGKFMGIFALKWPNIDSYLMYETRSA